MTSFASSISGSIIESQNDQLPCDRKGLIEYLRKESRQLPEQVIDVLDGLADQESLISQLDNYQSFICESPSQRLFCDFFEFASGLTWFSEPDSDQEKYIDGLSATVTKLVPFQAQFCSFANQTDHRRELYRKIPEVSIVCSYLKCPVIEASDSDYLVLTSINPYTANLAAEIIGKVIFENTGVSPFIFLTVCPVRTRNYLCSKHFGYES